MDAALHRGDYTALSKLGHFLKGSSAQIGLAKLKIACEKIQNVGRLLREDGAGSVTVDEALPYLGQLVLLAKQQYAEAELVLRREFSQAS
ncbi:hypothetical protein SmJEL517_g05262 [Synchytrium microbalum]|uniref:HPt domain-containing protein n=1 Tax=Synchytrium microbalum TaxID=1806994 RepID=A0A507C095_9FUNG|nr:uncharacterized protein SmJEL517_g05262 [Synchytrium microbalum]TPX31396.1 hypothetical protein SmJEL517_g05262 [Synchytrium microbalum]